MIFNDTKKFENSLVAFLPDILEKFFSGAIDEATFKKVFADNLKTTKIYLVCMSKELLEENKKIFRNEFIFADKLNAAIKNFSGQDLKNTIKNLIAQYNNNLI